MAPRGPVPADDTGNWEYILDTPNRKAPLVKLPESRGTTDEGETIAWHPLTKAWWDTVRALPHTAEWRADEWHALVGLAYIADTVYSTGQAAAHAEWRRGSDALGLTTEARRKLRIKLVDAEKLAQLAPHKVPAKPARKPKAIPATPAPSKRDDRRARSTARA
ncbi:hypothetical protein AB2L57_10720 [Microbacterium sp. HA-8]|uniref:phage terminase small subunit n=1 Tax=Microbacterium sp. HA-8 TaxID=3234200 RepID=UPI0038F6B33A